MGDGYGLRVGWSNHEYNMPRNQLRMMDTRREVDSSRVGFLADPTAPLWDAVDDGEEAGDDEIEDEEMEVVNLGVEVVLVVVVVVGVGRCREGVVYRVPTVMVDVDDELWD